MKAEHAFTAPIRFYFSLDRLYRSTPLAAALFH